MIEEYCLIEKIDKNLHQSKQCMKSIKISTQSGKRERDGEEQ